MASSTSSVTQAPPVVQSPLTPPHKPAKPTEKPPAQADSVQLSPAAQTALQQAKENSGYK